MRNETYGYMFPVGHAATRNMGIGRLVWQARNGHEDEDEASSMYEVPISCSAIICM